MLSQLSAIVNETFKKGILLLLEESTSITNLQVIGLIFTSIYLIFVLNKTDLSKLKTDRKWQHMVFGSFTLVFFLWLFRVSIYDGLIIQFLWMTSLSLVLGFRWATLTGFAVLLMSTIIGNETWSMLGVNAILMVFVPISITYAIFSFTFHRIPRQLFIYIFLCAFFPGALTIAVKMAMFSGYYYIEGFYDWYTISNNYLNMTILLVFNEAFFNGFSMTCLIVYKPDLVYTFNDKFYIDDK